MTIGFKAVNATILHVEGEVNEEIQASREPILSLIIHPMLLIAHGVYYLRIESCY